MCWIDTPNIPPIASDETALRRTLFRLGLSPLAPVRSHLGAGLPLAVSPVSRVTLRKSDSAARTSNWARCRDKPAIALVGHEDGQLRVLQNVLGRPTKDHLPQPALGIGALHQKISPQLLRLRQDRGTRRSPFILFGERHGWHTMEPNGRRDLLPARALNGRLFDREDN